MDLLERPRAYISKYHPTDSCCDASKRMADVVTLHAVAGNGGRFCLIRLADGSSDDALYDSREAVESHKTHPAQIPVLIPPAGMQACEAEEVLHYFRDLYEKVGKRSLEVPLSMPLLLPERAASIHALRKAR